MFQFPGCPPCTYGFSTRGRSITSAGFPHSDICGSRFACNSPQLFAACHVLLRRMVPWHPPCALISLIFSSLRPETNCSFSTLKYLLCFAPLPLFSASASLRSAAHSPFRNWPFFESFLVQLSRCVYRTLKTIQNLTLETASS